MGISCGQKWTSLFTDFGHPYLPKIIHSYLPKRIHSYLPFTIASIPMPLRKNALTNSRVYMNQNLLQTLDQQINLYVYLKEFN